MYQIKPTNKKQWWLGGNFFKMLLLAILVVVCFFVFNNQLFGGQLASTMLTPFFKAGDYFYQHLSYIPNIFSDKNKLLEEKLELLGAVENLRIAEMSYQSLKTENEQLRKELGLKPSKDSIAASIIGRPPQVPLDTLLLDKGSDDLVGTGDFVLANGRVLIGRIVKLNKQNATVALDSSSSVVSRGFLERTREPLEIRGFGGGGMQVKVPIDFDIVVGDKVIVANSLNYIAAIVGVVENNDSSGFKNVLLSLPSDVSKLQTVFIEHFISDQP